jgi:hypothetical protein
MATTCQAYVHIALLELLMVMFPESWYRHYEMFRVGAWWLHATVLTVSIALVFDYAHSRRFSIRQRLV